MGSKIAHLIRPINLLAIAFIQISCFYVGGSGSWLSFLFFVVVPTLLSALAGFLLNNYFDIEKDALNNKPKIAINNLPLYAILLNLAALLIAFMDNVQLFGVVLGIQLLLFLYNYKLSNWPLIGNVLVAFVACMVVLVLYFSNQVGFSITNVWVFIISIFLVSVAREIVKDMQDIDGDKANGAQTLPIVTGTTFSHFIADLMLFCNAFFILFLSYYLFYLDNNLAFYIGLGLSLMGVAIIVISHLLKNPNNYSFTSKALKVYMFLGLAILPFLNNA